MAATGMPFKLPNNEIFYRSEPYNASSLGKMDHPTHSWDVELQDKAKGKFRTIMPALLSTLWGRKIG
jgi:hypothetical protein